MADPYAANPSPANPSPASSSPAGAARPALPARPAVPALLTALISITVTVLLLAMSVWTDRPGAETFSVNDLRMIALCVMAIGLWASAIVPEHFTALAFFLGAMLLSVAPASVVFSGFHSTALWLVFAGLLIGTAIKNSGLAARFAAVLSARLGFSYARNVVGLVALGIALSFLMPSSLGRVLILMPIAVALVDRLGLVEGRKGRTGLLAAMGFGAVIPAFSILPANVPNLILGGLAETLYGTPPTYATYLAMHFPFLGLGKAAVIVAGILWLFPDRITAELPEESSEAVEQNATQSPISRTERVLLIVLSITLGLWATDALHGISPAWIGLGAALVCFLPGVAVLEKNDFNSLNFASLIYVAGVVALGAMIADSGLGTLLGKTLIEQAGIAPGEPIRSFLVIAASGALSGLALAAPGVPGVFTPIAEGLASASGLPLQTVLMTVVVSFSTIILPYQAPPLIIAMAYGKVSLGDAAKLTLFLTAASFLLLYPATAGWWRFTGHL
ncbi:MAG: SLC13 family permease [Pseudomonadota bacterium]